MFTGIEVLELVGFVGLLAPALACIVIARIIEARTTRGNRRARRMAFLVA